VNFVPLHNHTEFSTLDGLSTPKEVAERAAELGCPCCGITDHGTVAGHLQFYKELTAKGIKPILGCELYHGVKTEFSRNERDQAHFVAGAMTSEGLRNLWRLVDAASANFRYVGRVNWDMLAKYSEGLFATSACIQGLVPQGVMASDLTALDKYLEIFRDRFYIELHTYPGPDQEELNLALVQVATERGIPVVYANDAHFAFPGQYNVHDAYVAMQTGQSVDTPLSERKMWHPMALYMQDEWEIRDALGYLPESVIDEALRNTVDIGGKVDVSLPAVNRHLPKFIPADCQFVASKGVTAQTLFIDLVEQGVQARYGESPADEVWDRALREMRVFLDAGLEHYFLQTWDFCEFCNQQGIIRGPGRGSAAGSIVAYALGITDVDPLRYGLIFERFYNPGREKGYPDIDNDFPQEARKVVKEYLQERWGANRVRSIGNVIRLKPKAALDKTYQAMGVTYDEKEKLKSLVNQVPDLEIHGPESIGWSDHGEGKSIYVMNHVGREIEKWILTLPQEREPFIRRWLDFVDVVCGRVSGYGVHASGVVVSDVPLDEELPCMWSSPQKTQATMFPMKDVELRLFVKQDILGLRTLDTLQEWGRLMQANHDIDVQWSGLETKDHPEEMWQMLDKGLATGVFQIEEKAYVRQLAMDFRPRCVEDLSVIVALNRPGPIRSGAPDSFVRRRRGDEPVDYDHPSLEPILDETYGWFLYQEQVIAFFEQVLGYSMEDADAVRKILGKKKPEDMQALKEGKGEWEGKGYYEIAVPILGDSTQIIWDKLEQFAHYSFNKSHSMAYAVIAFRTLYAKYYAPREFIMACIRTNPDEAGAYVSEGRRLGIKVLPPNIRHSQSDIHAVGDEIYFGFSNVKGIGRSTGEYIRKLADKYDVHTKAELAEAIDQETAIWEEAKKRAQDSALTYRVPSPKQQCRANVISLLHSIGTFDNYEEREAGSLSHIQQTEKELLGIILTDDSQEVLEQNADLVDECDTYQDLQTPDVKVRVPGVVSSIRKTKTKKAQKDMGFVKIEYGEDSIEFAVFPSQWTAYKFLWKERTPGIFTLKKSERGINFEEGIKL
jgi:DNA polymerase-3 subunit alpha